MPNITQVQAQDDQSATEGLRSQVDELVSALGLVRAVAILRNSVRRLEISVLQDAGGPPSHGSKGY